MGNQSTMIIFSVFYLWIIKSYHHERKVKFLTIFKVIELIVVQCTRLLSANKFWNKKKLLKFMENCWLYSAYWALDDFRNKMQGLMHALHIWMYIFIPLMRRFPACITSRIIIQGLNKQLLALFKNFFSLESLFKFFT